MLESKIDDIACEKPSAIPFLIFLPPWCSSSRTRSKIRMFASTAVPIEIMNPAIPAAVRVTGTILKILKIINAWIT